MGEEALLTQYELLAIVFGIAMGTAARFVTIRIDARQVPSYPNGYLINLVTGFVAACLGAVAIPALLAKEYTAFTFLALAVQHLRDIRKQEQESLDAIERSEFAKRGSRYIDGIARTYEARNFLSLLTSLGTVLMIELVGVQSWWQNMLIALITGTVLICALIAFTKSKQVGDICGIAEGYIDVQGGELYVDGLFITNTLGTEQAQRAFREEGVAVVVAPRQPKHRLTIEHVGQRQAMLHDAIRNFGVKEHQFTRRRMDDGSVVIAFIPILHDPEGIMNTIGATPILETGRKRRLMKG